MTDIDRDRAATPPVSEARADAFYTRLYPGELLYPLRGPSDPYYEAGGYWLEFRASHREIEALLKVANDPRTTGPSGYQDLRARVVPDLHEWMPRPKPFEAARRDGRDADDGAWQFFKGALDRLCDLEDAKGLPRAHAKTASDLMLSVVEVTEAEAAE